MIPMRGYGEGALSYIPMVVGSRIVVERVDMRSCHLSRMAVDRRNVRKPADTRNHQEGDKGQIGTHTHPEVEAARMTM